MIGSSDKNRRITCAIKRAAYPAVGILAGVLLLAGCGKSLGRSPSPAEQPLWQENGKEDPDSKKREVHYYQIEESGLPDADRELELLLTADRMVSAGWEEDGTALRMAGDTVYRIVTITGEVEKEDPVKVYGKYVQYLAPPYEKWVSLQILDSGWKEGSWCAPEKFCVSEDGRMLVLLKETQSSGLRYGVGELHRDGTQEYLWDISEEEGRDNIVFMEEWRIVDWETQQGMLSVGPDAANLQTARAADGSICFADAGHLWRYGKEESVELLNFHSQDIVLDRLYGLSVAEDGFWLLGAYKGKDYLLRLKEVAEPVKIEKKEIVLAEPFVTGVMQDAIACFNRQSRNYRVVIRTAKKDNAQGYADMRSEIQLELSAGRGPDILGSSVLWDYESCAVKGYLECLDSVTEESKDFYPGAMESGVLNGVRYGVPVKYNLMLTVGNRKMVGERESWNIREMMKAVEQSEAEYLCGNFTLMDGFGIVYYYGLLDNDETAYIDWKAGKSHLTEKPFLELMEFAKKYAGDEQGRDITWDTLGPALREGKVAMAEVQLAMLNQMQAYEEIYEGEEAFIGYPCAEGSGVWLLTFEYYLNSASQNKEGAMEFLRYLLTEEGQLILTDVDRGGGFPVRRSTMEANVELALKNPCRLEGITVTNYGVSYPVRRLTREEGQKFLELAEGGKAASWKVSGISDILREELEPFFRGEKTAEEAARILDNRVQLYLDEREKF